MDRAFAKQSRMFRMFVRYLRTVYECYNFTIEVTSLDFAR